MPSSYLVLARLRERPLLFCGIAFLSGFILTHYELFSFTAVQKLSLTTYGADFLPSLGILLIASSVIGAVVTLLARLRVDAFSLAVLALAAIVSLHYIHISSNTAYTNNWGDHVTYATYISNNWLNPYGYTGGEWWVPPFYYYVAGALIALTEALKTIPILTAIRFLSWICYLIFNAFGLLTLRRAGLSGGNYRACVVLFLLWPAGIHIASKISSEIFYYAWYEAAFYFALVWYQSGIQRNLVVALLLAGVAFMTRGQAVILFVIIALLMIAALYRGRYHLSSLWSKQWGVLGIALAICFIITFGRWIGHPFDLNTFDGGNHLGTGLSFKHYLFFNFYLSLLHPFNDWSDSQSFWDYVLKSAVFGEYQWPWHNYASGLIALVYMAVFYALVPWLAARRTDWQGMLPFIAGLVVPVFFLIGYSAIETTYKFQAQDFRYIYPALTCFVACFGRSQTIFTSRGAMLLGIAGSVLAWSFGLLSLVYFWECGR